MLKRKITFDKVLDDGTEVMVLASASEVTPYTARDLKVEVYSADGSDLKAFSLKEIDSIEEEAIEKFNEQQELEF